MKTAFSWNAAKGNHGKIRPVMCRKKVREESRSDFFFFPSVWRWPWPWHRRLFRHGDDVCCASFVIFFFSLKPFFFPGRLILRAPFLVSAIFHLHLLQFFHLFFFPFFFAGTSIRRREKNQNTKKKEKKKRVPPQPRTFLITIVKPGTTRRRIGKRLSSSKIKHGEEKKMKRLMIRVGFLTGLLRNSSVFRDGMRRFLSPRNRFFQDFHSTFFWIVLYNWVLLGFHWVFVSYTKLNFFSFTKVYRVLLGLTGF